MTKPDDSDPIGRRLHEQRQIERFDAMAEAERERARDERLVRALAHEDPGHLDDL